MGITGEEEEGKSRFLTNLDSKLKFIHSEFIDVNRRFKEVIAFRHMNGEIKLAGLYMRFIKVGFLEHRQEYTLGCFNSETLELEWEIDLKSNDAIAIAPRADDLVVVCPYQLITVPHDGSDIEPLIVHKNQNIHKNMP